MSDVTKDAVRPLVDMVNGTERTFLEMSVYDRADLLDALTARCKAKLLANLKDSQAEAAQVFAQLEDFDARSEAKESDWESLVNSPRGKVDVIAKSLEKSYPGEGDALAKCVMWDQPTTLVNVARLAGLAVVTRRVTPEGEQGPNPTPSQPPDLTTYGTT